VKAGKRLYVSDVGKLLKTERKCSSEYTHSIRLTKKLIMKTNDKAFCTITHITFPSLRPKKNWCASSYRRRRQFLFSSPKKNDADDGEDHVFYS